MRDDGLTVLLTQRTDAPERPRRPGQLSRRPRRARATPTRSRPRCARRRRRSASTARHVEVLGQLPTYTTGHQLRRHAGGRRWCAPASQLRLDRVRSRRGVRGAARLPDEPGATTSATRSSSTACGASSSRCRGMAPTRSGSRARYFIWGATAAMLRNLYRFLRRLTRGRARPPLSSAAMSFFAVLFALLIEQVQAAAARQLGPRRADRAGSRWTGRNFDAGRERHAWVVWCVTVLAPALRGLAASTSALAQLSALLGAGLRRRGAVPHARLSPVQPLLHRHPRRARRAATKTQARRLLAEWRHLDASELPRTELLRHVIEHSLLAAHRHVFGVFFWFVRAVGVRPRAGRRGAVPHGRVRRAATGRYQAAARSASPVNERLMRAVAAPVPLDRPRAGAPHRVRLRRGRQLRGGGQLLAPRCRRCGCTPTKA